MQLLTILLTDRLPGKIRSKLGNTTVVSLILYLSITVRSVYQKTQDLKRDIQVWLEVLENRFQAIKAANVAQKTATLESIASAYGSLMIVI